MACNLNFTVKNEGVLKVTGMFEVWWNIVLLSCYKFKAESNSKRILKIDQYFVKLEPKIQWHSFISGHGVVHTLISGWWTPSVVHRFYWLQFLYPIGELCAMYCVHGPKTHQFLKTYPWCNLRKSCGNSPLLKVRLTAELELNTQPASVDACVCANEEEPQLVTI